MAQFFTGGSAVFTRGPLLGPDTMEQTASGRHRALLQMGSKRCHGGGGFILTTLSHHSVPGPAQTTGAEST